MPLCIYFFNTQKMHIRWIVQQHCYDIPVNLILYVVGIEPVSSVSEAAAMSRVPRRQGKVHNITVVKCHAISI
jgi:hypothetical protein